MNISDYVEKARSTAIYPKEARFYYPALGLAGELGEIIDKLTLLPKEVPSHKEAVIKEAGDLLWYVVNTAIDAGVPVLNFTGHNPHNFTDLGLFQHPSKDTRSPLIKLSIHVGRIAEIAKKMIRDDRLRVDAFQPIDDKLTSEKQAIVHDSLEEIVRCLCSIAKEWSINMDDVAQANIDKLFSRKKRGVLQGEGDNR